MDRKKLHELVEIAHELAEWLKKKGVNEDDQCLLKEMVDNIQWDQWVKDHEEKIEEVKKDVRDPSFDCQSSEQSTAGQKQESK